MPALDFPLAELETYRGRDPKPEGFEDYWSSAIEELDSIQPKVELTPSASLQSKHAECFDLYFDSVGGARIHAKYLRPQRAKGCPALLKFHGYTMDSGEWSDKLTYVAEGFCVAVMDCRGQGGLSQDVGGVAGNTHRGHIIRGLDQGKDHLLYRQIYLDTLQLARVVSNFPEVDEDLLVTEGASQGGALALVCAALEPLVRRCVSVYPFLSDFRRVWEMDLAKKAYEELAWYFRFRDPNHLREAEIFETLGFIDIRHLVPKVNADVLMGITLMDDVCPPSSQFAAYNAICSPKQKLVFHDYGHEALRGMGDATFRFLSRVAGK